MCDCCSAHAHVHTAIIKIEGMTCGHCKAAVEKGLGSLSGVEKVEVSLENKEAKVEYNPALVTLDAIKNVVTEEGYTVI